MKNRRRVREGVDRNGPREDIDQSIDRARFDSDGPGYGRIPVFGRKKVLCVLLFLFLLVIAFQSARMGVSGLIVELGQREVDRWSLSQRKHGMREVNRVARFFSDSMEFVADNPWALEGLAALDLARMRLSTVPAEALKFTRDAKMRFRHALTRRPTSPFLWANFALAKLYLDEIDEELFAALRNANELGPREPAPQEAILFVGLATWEKLDPGLKESMVRTLERGAARNGAKMFEIVKSFRRFDLVCGLKSYDVIVGADCRPVGESPSASTPLRKGKRR